MSNDFTINTLTLTFKNYDSEKVKDQKKRGRDYKQFKIIDKKKQKSEQTDKKLGQKCKNHYGLK